MIKFEVLGQEVTFEEWNYLMIENSNGKELVVENGKVVAVEPVPKEKFIKLNKLAEIDNELTELNKDFIQELCGAIIPNIEEKKARFRELHNEKRKLLGLEPREYI